MAVSDNIVEGDSYFIAEIKAMKRLVNMAEAPGFCYFFIDEILRGTNTVERIAAAYAFLKHFNIRNIICFAASRDIELVALTDADYAQCHFEETIANGEIEFSFKLMPGPAKTRNALKLLESQRFPGAITHTANRLVRHFEETDSWN